MHPNCGLKWEVVSELRWSPRQVFTVVMYIYGKILNCIHFTTFLWIWNKYRFRRVLTLQPPPLDQTNLSRLPEFLCTENIKTRSPRISWSFHVHKSYFQTSFLFPILTIVENIATGKRTLSDEIKYGFVNCSSKDRRFLVCLKLMLEKPCNFFKQSLFWGILTR